MDFGIFNLTQQRHRTISSREVIDTAMAQTVLAEELGFSRAWFVEHHFSNYSICGSPLMLATYAAAKTSRIRLGSAVIVAGLHTPARLLTEIATLDTLSDGRLDVGLGSGYQEFEFERFGVDMAGRQQRLLEMLDMLRLGLTRPVFEYQGAYYRQLPTAISVRPVQQPMPPIWLAGHDPVLHRRCAREGHTPFIPSRFADVEGLKPLRRLIDDAWTAEGKDPAAAPLGLLSFCHVTDSRADSLHYVDCARYQHRISMSLRNRKETVVEDYWVDEKPFDDEPPIEQMARNLAVGDPDTVAERLLHQIRIVRPTHIAFYFQVGDMDRAKVMRSMERFMGEVVPRLEKALGRPIGEVNMPAAAAAE